MVSTTYLHLCIHRMTRSKVIFLIILYHNILWWLCRYNAPIVCLTPMSSSVTLSQSLGLPDHPAYVPSFWLRYSDSMSFSERLYNTAIVAAELFVAKVAFWNADEQMLANLYTYPGHQNCPPLDELRRAVQLTLVNSHYSVSYPRPYPPHVVQAAGMHMRPKTSVSVNQVSCTRPNL